MTVTKVCFVCKESIKVESYELNIEVNMPVCKLCKGTAQEKKMVEEMLDSLAEGLICGCI
jgi:hypothetical protein